MVLLHAIADDQLWNFAIECHICGKLSALPDLPAGRALPHPVVMLPNGRYLIKGSLDMRRVVTVGEQAVQQHRRETGSEGASIAAKPQRPPRTIDCEVLRAWLRRLADLLGPTLDKLLQSDRRATSSPTPPKHRHGLMIAVQAIEDGIQSFSMPDPILDLRVLEAHGLLELLTRWGGHPLWQQFVRGLESEYHHTIATLAVATFLQDAGNSVEFRASSSSRTPDLMLVLSARSRCAVEIKAPRVLIDRSNSLTAEEATKILTTALKKAGTGTKGQLSRSNSAFLAIAGFNLGPSDINVLESAANRYLKQATTRSRHRHLLAILLFSVTALVETLQPAGERKVSNVVTTRIANNPGYSGPHRVSQQSQQILRRIRGLD